MAFAVVIVAGLIGSVGNAFVSLGQNLGEVLGLVDPAKMDSAMALGALFGIFVTNAITVGVNNYFIKNTDSKPSFKDAFSGFKVKYGRNIVTLLLVGIKTVLWTLLTC